MRWSGGILSNPAGTWPSLLGAGKVGEATCKTPRHTSGAAVWSAGFPAARLPTVQFAGQEELRHVVAQAGWKITSAGGCDCDSGKRRSAAERSSLVGEPNKWPPQKMQLRESESGLGQGGRSAAGPSSSHAHNLSAACQASGTDNGQLKIHTTDHSFFFCATIPRSS